MLLDPDLGFAPTSAPAPRLHSANPKRARSPWLRLLSILLQLGQGKGELLTHAERPWASVTFSGTRHTVTLVFTGAENVEAGELMIALLPDHEFTIAGQLVADAAVTRTQHSLLPQPRLELEVELLLLEDG